MGGGVAVSQLCTAGMQDGTDGGGTRPVAAADLCSSLGCLSLRPSHFSSDSLKHIHHCRYSKTHRHMMWRAERFPARLSSRPLRGALSSNEIPPLCTSPVRLQRLMLCSSFLRSHWEALHHARLTCGRQDAVQVDPPYHAAPAQHARSATQQLLHPHHV